MEKQLREGIVLQSIQQDHEVIVMLCFEKDGMKLFDTLYQYAYDLETMYGVSFAWKKETDHAMISYRMTGIHYPEESEKAMQFSRKWEENFENLIRELQ